MLQALGGLARLVREGAYREAVLEGLAAAVGGLDGVLASAAAPRCAGRRAGGRRQRCARAAHHAWQFRPLKVCNGRNQGCNGKNQVMQDVRG